MEIDIIVHIMPLYFLVISGQKLRLIRKEFILGGAMSGF